MMNAVKYTPDGGRVSSPREIPAGFPDIMIIDDGVGIDPTNLPQHI